MDYDLITVGGGLAGAALARVMAGKGARVLVLEREVQFTDRVRGEALLPWGVAEARALGIYDLLRDGGGHEVRWWRSSMFGRPGRTRDMLETTPHQATVLDFYHPEMQETLLGGGCGGADVRRGATVVAVAPGTPPTVTFADADGTVREARARLVVGADGRTSRVRTWAGFAVSRDPECMTVGGGLFTGIKLPQHEIQVILRPPLGQGVLAFPLGNDRTRLYFVYYRTGAPRRISGRQNLPAYIAACIDTGVDPESFAGAELVGPLAMFEGADTWVAHPYREGIALIGDAAAASDPTWGCGLSLTLRDVRMLRDYLLASEDWDGAAHAYAADHDRCFAVVHRVEEWARGLQYEVGPDADARRERVYPRLAAEADRAPDLVGHGPDGPNTSAEALAYFS